MEDTKVLQAIHNLEVKLSEKISEQTTTLAVNNDRLDNLRIAVDRHREILYGHDDGDTPGLISKMKSLEKVETERKLTLRGVTAAFVGLCGKFLWDVFHP